MAVIEIDGRRIEAEAGQMLIEASDRAGIYIPRFCYHEKLSVAANCRMCLVEVERAPKPLPACATPVTDGMKVFTRSQLTRQAQQATLEFLLINHPLDCPVCDQGGECPLQDQAMGYGSDDSRFIENKRSVPSPNIGPLVATELTRCIHCTRCVRFGEEIAGAMEIGFPGRGESVHIGTFLNGTVDSEVSGNMIDLCPVGALTSKPYRFAARVWELKGHRGISPHDCVGANLIIQTLRGRVERVLPHDNPQVNECWLADRDRYSYEAVNSERRLSVPMIRTRGQWQEVAWETALQHACAGLGQVIESGSADDLGALAGYASTLEEYYLLQKLARALGSNNIDHRLQQRDFRDDRAALGVPVSQLPIERFEAVRAALLVGSNIRKEQPLLALRLRAAVRKNDARISAINPLAYPQNFATETMIAAGAGLVARFASVAAGIAGAGGAALPADIEPWVNPNQSVEPGVAHSLLEAGADGVVILGALAQQHEEAAALRRIARWICQSSGNRLAILPPGNSAAAWLAGCLPHRDASGAAVAAASRDAAAMLDHPRRAYLLLGTEPELDGVDGRAAIAALQDAEFVVSITPYHSQAALGYADVLLPMATFAESAGTFVNCEGRIQRAEAAASPQGESRPAWKILRVLGNFLDLPGFDQISLEQVAGEIALDEAEISARMGWMDAWPIPAPGPDGGNDSGNGNANEMWRLLDVPMYRGDQIVRNAAALQRTADNPPPAAHVHPATIERLGLIADERVVVRMRTRNGSGSGRADLPLQADARVPRNCVYVPAGYVQTAGLGGHGWVTLEQGVRSRRR